MLCKRLSKNLVGVSKMTCHEPSTKIDGILLYLMLLSTKQKLILQWIIFTQLPSSFFVNIVYCSKLKICAHKTMVEIGFSFSQLSINQFLLPF